MTPKNQRNLQLLMKLINGNYDAEIAFKDKNAVNDRIFIGVI